MPWLEYAACETCFWPVMVQLLKMKDNQCIRAFLTGTRPHTSSTRHADTSQTQSAETLHWSCWARTCTHTCTHVHTPFLHHWQCKPRWERDQQTATRGEKKPSATRVKTSPQIYLKPQNSALIANHNTASANRIDQAPTTDTWLMGLRDFPLRAKFPATHCWIYI